MARKASSGNSPKKSGTPRKPKSKSVLEQADLFDAPTAGTMPPKVKASPKKPRTSKGPTLQTTAPRPPKETTSRESISKPSAPKKPPKLEYPDDYEKVNPATVARGKKTKTPPFGRIPYKTIIIVLYVGIVLLYDALITSGDTRTVNWAVFQWRPVNLMYLLQSINVPDVLVGWLKWQWLSRFDLFKLVFWLLIPFGFSMWSMDWDYFRTHKLTKADWYLLAGFSAIGLAAIVSVKMIPWLAAIYPGLGDIWPMSKIIQGLNSLAAIYPGLGDMPISERFKFFLMHLVWIVSWLPAWEFMNRYFLLKSVSTEFPKFGWLIVPLAEGLYHLQKPWPEAAGMVIFSLCMTYYVLKRRNLVIPFLAHLVIELLLLMGILVW